MTPNGRQTFTRRRPGGVTGQGALVLLTLALSAGGSPLAAESDTRAVELAESVLEKMGGRRAWDETRVIHWRFFGRRLHYWDRATGDVRIESDGRVVLMNLWTTFGRVWQNGAALEGPALRQALDEAYAWWVNDSYWFLMPYKLLDPGVNLRDGGPSPLADGRPADRLVLTFDEGVGLTPENKYDVWIARDTGLVEQWAYYPEASDAEPAFTLPWGGWKRFGEILLATEHGRGADWDVAVFDEPPPSVFETP